MWWTRKLPRTLDEAADHVLKLLSPEEREKFVSYAEQDLILLHHSLGMYIRNEFGLWDGRNKALLSQFEYRHPDDISSIIIRTAWKKLRARMDTKHNT